MVDGNEENYPKTSTLTVNEDGEKVLVTESGPTKHGGGDRVEETRKKVSSDLKKLHIKEMGGIPREDPDQR